MPVSDAQKRASNKYNREHMSTLSCKVRKDQAAAFKVFCQSKGQTSNTVLKEYVLTCIDEESAAGTDTGE